MLIELAKQILEYEKPAKYRVVDAKIWRERLDANRRKLRRYMRRKYGALAPSINELFYEKLQNTTKFQIGTLALESDTDEKTYQRLRDSIVEETKILQDLVLHVLPKGKIHLILFDQLDRAWDNENQIKQMLTGLLLAARDLLRASSLIGKRLRIIIFLRDDIYTQLRFEDKNKLTPNITRLVWNETSLQALIEQRIRTTSKLAWGDVFAATSIRQQSPFDFMLQRTLFRPRDIIYFCNLSLARAREQRHDFIYLEDITYTESIQSEFMRQEYQDETQATHPYFDLLLETIREIGRIHFQLWQFLRAYRSKQATENDLLQLRAEDALNALIELSVIGVIKPVPSVQKGYRPRTEYLYRYKVDPIMRLVPKSRLEVHPSLVKVLNLLETDQPTPKPKSKKR